MDLTDIKSKLHALENLYGLLLQNYEDTCHLSSDKLDDGARYLLKNLLDKETERVFKAHSEIIERKRVDESSTSQQVKDSIMNTRFHVGEVSSQAPIGDREDLTTDLSFSPGKEQNVCDPASREAEVNQSNMASTASASENRKKRCRICHREQSKPSITLSDRGGAQTPKEVNDLPSVVLSGSSKENLSSQGGQYDLCSTGISEYSPINNAAAASVNIKGTNSFSKRDADFVSGEASAAVVQIQSHITALKLDAESLLPPRKRSARFGLMATVTDSRLPSKGGEPVADMASSQALKQLTNAPGLLVNQLIKPQLNTQNMMEQIESEQKIGENSGQTNRKQQTLQNIVPSPDTRTNSNRFESLCDQIIPVDRLRSRNRRDRGFGFQEHEAKKSNWRLIPSARLINQMNIEDRDNQSHRNDEDTRQTVVDHTSHIVHPSQKPSRGRHFPVETPNLSLAEHEPSQPSVLSVHDNSVDLHQDRFLSDKKKIKRSTRKEPMDQRETECTDSDYSPRANQLSSDSSNEIDQSSAAAEIDISGTPSSRSESDDVYSQPRRTRHFPATSTSSSETEVYSSASRTDTEIYSSTSSSGSDQAATSSNERHKYPSYVRSRPGTKNSQEQSYSSDDSASSRESGGAHTKPSRDRKKRGGVKKLKDKLAIVFHHHHNHHHHLHHSDKKDQNNPPAAKMNPSKSLWKRSKKVTQLEREKEIKGEHAIEKLGKSIVQGGAKKNKHGHFYELMKGLLRHKRHSKQSKKSRLLHESKKTPKTSHWWKLLQNQKRSKRHKGAHTKIR